MTTTPSESSERDCPRATPEHAAHTKRLAYTVRGRVGGVLGFGGREVEESFTMVVVPPCAFTIGNPASKYPWDTPHDVQLTRTYAIATAPVTQALYEVVMGVNPSQHAVGPDALQRPVGRVMWFDAVRFCNALSAKLGLRAAYGIGVGLGRAFPPPVRMNEGADGFRLPMEAEWECAARAGTDHTYAGGDDPDAVAWWGDSTPRGPQPVGGKRANAWGLHDMSGNAGEWCEDVAADYPSGAVTDPRGPTGPTRMTLSDFSPKRIMRGGSWYSDAPGLTVHNRHAVRPTNLDDRHGFRLARTVV